MKVSETWSSKLSNIFSQSIINMNKDQICIQLDHLSTLLLSFRWLFMPIWSGALTNEQLTNLPPCFTHFNLGYPSCGYHYHLSLKKLRTQFLFSFCFQCDNCPERLATTWGSGPTLPPLQRWKTIWTNICQKYFLVIDKRLKCIKVFLFKLENHGSSPALSTLPRPCSQQ